MLELLKVLLDKLDFIELARFIHARRSRLLAARLHLVLVQAFEILELYRVLLAELRAALRTHTTTTDGHRFYLNPAHIASLLSRQSSNLSVMETLTLDLLDELRVIDNKFVETFRSILPHKSSILFEAETLLASGRLPLAETGPDVFPASLDGSYRALRFTDEAPKTDRRDLEQYLYGWTGQDKVVVDVATSDGEAFFNELSNYFATQDPEGKLCSLMDVTETYKETLMKTFTTEDLLADLGKVRRHYSHLP
jgi:hypothetical protein